MSAHTMSGQLRIRGTRLVPVPAATCDIVAWGGGQDHGACRCLQMETWFVEGFMRVRICVMTPAAQAICARSCSKANGCHRQQRGTVAPWFARNKDGVTAGGEQAAERVAKDIFDTIRQKRTPRTPSWAPMSPHSGVCRSGKGLGYTNAAPSDSPPAGLKWCLDRHEVKSVPAGGAGQTPTGRTASPSVPSWNSATRSEGERPSAGSQIARHITVQKSHSCRGLSVSRVNCINRYTKRDRPSLEGHLQPRRLPTLFGTTWGWHNLARNIEKRKRKSMSTNPLPPLEGNGPSKTRWLRARA
ncbi:hypothetical protein LX32DRAFT_363822 [Colletotrichum zoysiae]|uniref:Uncharacterized protein n=1 Tax=Colletotrichum zoysiae TaxID=1216348 RepID=A0AAD9M5N4_9PEZI|nr:hypothetical protein LX32DRAFT_363822 [Colletotrichum zoysiae]